MLPVSDPFLQTRTLLRLSPFRQSQPGWSFVSEFAHLGKKNFSALCGRHIAVREL